MRISHQSDIGSADATTGSPDESLSVLALIAMQVTGADGFVYFRRSKTGGLVRSQGSGIYIQEEALSGHGLQIATAFPLRLCGAVDGLLAFAFSDREKLDFALSPLKQLVSMIEKLWAQSNSKTYRRVLEGIIAPETELVHAKHVSRARGIFKEQPDKEALEHLIRYVDRLQRPIRTFRMLHLILEQLQKEAEDRQWVARAISLFLGAHGMSDEETHSSLQQSRRKSPRHVLAVARQIVEERRETRGPESFHRLQHSLDIQAQDVDDAQQHHPHR